MAGESALNMRLLAHNPLNGFGNCGEGMAIQLTRGGRRVLWLAHESPPKNVTAVDVTEPRKPRIIFQSELPHGEMRSNSLDVVGDLLVVAYQTSRPGLQPAGFEIFDVDESTADGAADWPKLVWVLDARDETNLVPISTCPLPPVTEFARRGGRYGAHNLHENRPAPGSWVSETVILGTFFNGGVRAFDLSDPFRPEEVAHFVPPAPSGSPRGAAQLNDVFVDERGIVYTVDRFTGGLYILEMRL